MRFGCRAAPQHLENSSIQQNRTPPNTICPARSQHPVQDPPHLLHTAIIAFDIAVAHGMPGIGYSSRAGRTLCAVVAERCLHIWKTPAFSKSTSPAPIASAQPGRSTQCRLHQTCCTQQRLHLTLQWPMTCPRLATHTLAGLCALWLSSSASTSGKLQRPAKPHTPKHHLPSPSQHTLQDPPHLLHTAIIAF